MTTLATAALLALIAVSSPAKAHDHDGTYDLKGATGLGAGIGYAAPVWSNTFNTTAEPDLGWGVWFRHHPTSHWVVGLDFIRDEFKDVPASFSAMTFGADYRFGGASRLATLAGLRLGFSQPMDAGSDDKGRGYIIAPRVGVVYSALKNLTVDAVVEYHFVDAIRRDEMPSGGWHVATPKVGLTYYFAALGAPAPAKAAETAPPAAAVATPPPPPDADGDGVPDASDKCPGTAAGSTVTAFGCAPQEKASFTLDVRFKTGSSVIESTYVDDIKAFAEFLAQNPTVRATIEGHTDSKGARARNVAISRARAQAVVDYLVKNHGVDAKRLKAAGIGPANPIADNETEEGRAKNRRVVAIIEQ
jgi:outer membrane protein OmpA-like peptidoglycan-associated protein